ncbi:mechanosensitive ion channel [Salinimonas marina]|uniref:Small-conductance mechanosensitive channel n=1 Tax=Salinimonas marina TaxID=2785918 RepID=A0A7S9DV70_9ALTE|nr:mechanosensitive ion channel domain-containing protein [Salinimonas marina]QPG04572.1 mechanosensitive ion channel [Salinimonas marina]
MWVWAGLQGAGQSETQSQTQVLSDMVNSVGAHLPGIGIGLVLLLVSIFISGPLATLLLKPFAHLTQSPLIRSVSHRAIAILCILLGVYVFLKLAGLTEFAVAIISGTGLLGLILGFAFRDIAENFISSLLLTVQRPFRLGDVVQIDSYLGVVQKVTARATTLVDFDGNHIQIPNASIYKGVIKNLTANPNMRGHFIIGVGYDNDIKHAQQLALKFLTAHDNILTQPEPQVLIDNLGSATANLKVYFWIDVEKTSELKMASVLMRELVVLFDNAGISMPDDARERVFPQGVPGLQSDGGHSRPDSETQSPENTNSQAQVGTAKTATAPASASDDVSSETTEIRRQAAQARDPEDGENIL